VTAPQHLFPAVTTRPSLPSRLIENVVAARLIRRTAPRIAEHGHHASHVKEKRDILVRGEEGERGVGPDPLADGKREGTYRLLGGPHRTDDVDQHERPADGDGGGGERRAPPLLTAQRPRGDERGERGGQADGEHLRLRPAARRGPGGRARAAPPPAGAARRRSPAASRRPAPRPARPRPARRPRSPARGPVAPAPSGPPGPRPARSLRATTPRAAPAPGG